MGKLNPFGSCPKDFRLALSFTAKPLVYLSLAHNSTHLQPSSSSRMSTCVCVWADERASKHQPWQGAGTELDCWTKLMAMPSRTTPEDEMKPIAQSHRREDAFANTKLNQTRGSQPSRKPASQLHSCIASDRVTSSPPVQWRKTTQST